MDAKLLPKKRIKTIRLKDDGSIDIHLCTADIAAIKALQKLAEDDDLDDDTRKLVLKKTQLQIADILCDRINDIVSAL